MKKQNSKKLFKTMGACLLVGVIGASTLVGCATNQETTSKENLNIPVFESIFQNSENIEGVSVIPENSNVIKLFSSEPTVVNEGNEVYVEQTITATVLPLDTPYQNVTWELMWETEEDDDVLDYVTITPNESNSKILTLRCYQAFLGKNMRLVCKTEVGGFSTYATVIYYGKPSQFYLSYRPELTQDEIWNVGYYQLTSGTTYTPQICLRNVFNCVNPDYVPEYNVEVTAFGGINTDGDYSCSLYATNTLTDMSFNEGLVFDKTSGSVYLASDGYNFNIADFNVEGDILTINALNAPEEYSRELSVGTTNLNIGFYSFQYGKPCYFSLKVTELKSNISKTYNFRIVSSVSGVTLDAGEVVF